MSVFMSGKVLLKLNPGFPPDVLDSILERGEWLEACVLRLEEALGQAINQLEASRAELAIMDANFVKSREECAELSEANAKLHGALVGVLKTSREFANDWELQTDDNYEYWFTKAREALGKDST